MSPIQGRWPDNNIENITQTYFSIVAKNLFEGIIYGAVNNIENITQTFYNILAK